MNTHCDTRVESIEPLVLNFKIKAHYSDIRAENIGCEVAS